MAKNQKHVKRLAVGAEPVKGPEQATDEAPRLKRYRVSLNKHALLTTDLDAFNEDDAWEKFKKKHGILASDIDPEFTELEETPAPVARRGPSPAHPSVAARTKESIEGDPLVSVDSASATVP
jgi:hypothetical protein